MWSTVWPACVPTLKTVRQPSHQPLVLGDLPGHDVQVADQRGVVVVEDVERRDVLSRHDEHMRRRLRVDIAEGDGAVVLLDQLRWDLAVDDLAEQAVAHGARYTST